ncbi:MULTISPECIES: MFS transporter [unclassified Modestobacter]|uniref:MFS transporter n=1 Tax=unclassified Modestobacter TaxID=2643866 RepID=UPI0022AAEBCC|nr:MULTISPECIES: MFS transporter [unclassified Modestobacter]MCZ2826568.1 MFS transporter [Modestobacter sp. VKM Ac-2981]MCZ2854948.1 MFS transporter [Modestobacter sp. VKM Ac-2982]
MDISVPTRPPAPSPGRLRSAFARALPPSAPPSLRRLRVAVALLFGLDGFVFGSWAARVPDVSAATGAGHTALGVALLCLSLGALACMQVTGALCARLGTGRLAALAGVAASVSAVLPGLAGTVPALCAGLFLFGAVTGAVNVAANSVGVEVEARAGRPLLSGLHAAFSGGGLVGALVGGLASAVMGVAPHLAAVAVVGLVAMAWAGPVLVRGDAPRPLPTADPLAPDTGGAPGPRPTGVLVLLGAVAGATAYGEGALSDWGALHLREQLAAAPALAAAGYAGFSSAMAAGRLAGGRLVLALGERQLLVGGSLLAAAGALTAVTTTSLPVALAGFVVVGLGLANVFPLAIARAGALGGPSGVALSTTVGYTGLLGGPPVIGFLAEHAGLPAALGTVALMAVLAAVLVLGIEGEQVRRPVLPWRGRTYPVLFGRRPVAVVLRPVGVVLRPAAARVNVGACSYVRDLQLLEVG